LAIVAIAALAMVFSLWMASATGAHAADRVVADRLVQEIGEVVVLGVERGRATREVRDRDRRAEEDPPGRRADQVEDVAAVAVHAAHRIDEVGALEAGDIHPSPSPTSRT
jgi:hypothetical protein